MKFYFRLTIGLLIFITVFFSGCVNNDNKINDNENSKNCVNWSYAEVILKRINVPVFADKTYNILDFGAIGDGITDCSEAIINAINSCNENGGGTVLVPEGIFLTGKIHLQSNVNFHISKGATLKFSTDKSKYLPIVHTRFEGMECMNYSPFIYAYEKENIAVTGEGVIDGQGQAWWNWKGPWEGLIEIGWKEGMPNQLDDVALLHKMVEDYVPVEKRIFGEAHLLRPNFIQPYKCKNILIEGITIINSPMWIIHPVLSENITIKNVKIESLGPNNDGCDPESCKNILIKACYFNNGDDCIAIKSGRNNDGRKHNIPCEDIVVQDCIMKEGHGGIVIGSEISGGVKNIFAENCYMDSPHLERALRIKSNSLRGGKVENIFFRNSEVKQVKEAVIKVNMFYESFRSDYIPSVSNIVVENIISEKSKYAVWIKAYKSEPVRDIQLVNCEFHNAKSGLFIENASNMVMKNVNFYSSEN